MIKTLYPCFQHWSAKGSIYLISDTHFDDPNCKLIDANWITPEEYIKKLSFITKNDTLIHLGDVGNPEYLTKLKCYKVLIMGNHDQSKTKFEPYFDEIYGGALVIAPKIILSHEPLDVTWALNIHGHEHNNKYIYNRYHLNIASNLFGYNVLNLTEVIKVGFLSCIDDIHRQTIDFATAHSRK